jgi:hypothetical protein
MSKCAHCDREYKNSLISTFNCPCSCHDKGRVADVRDIDVPEPPKEAQGFETLVFRVVQDRAVSGVPNVRPDVDEILAAHATATREAVREFAENIKRHSRPGTGFHHACVPLGYIDQELSRWEKK